MAVLLVMFGAVPALAAGAAEAATGIADDGVFVERGASTDDAEIGDLVSAARNDGERVSIVVLSEEPVSGATTFADAVVDRAGLGLVIVIAPDTIGWAGTGVVYTVDELNNALDIGFDGGGDDGDVARSIIEALTGRPVPTSPAAPTTVAQTTAPAASSSSGGGGSGFLIFVALVGIAVLGFLWLRSRSKKQQAVAADARIEAARAEVQQRIDDVANDLLDIEDEVRVADNSRADRFYNQAGATYREVSVALPTATSPQELIELSNRLDVAIWQLDTAEAILDGTDLPQRPEPRRLEPERVAPGRSASPPRAPSGGSYERRSSRRSSYGSGSSTMEMLVQLGLAYAAGRSRASSRGSSSRTPRSGGLGGLFGGGSSRTTTSTTRRHSPVPGPSSPTTPRSTRSARSSRSSRSSTPRGTGGRARGGRRRRQR